MMLKEKLKIPTCYYGKWGFFLGTGKLITFLWQEPCQSSRGIDRALG